jgi:hypothetical protein
MGMKKEILRETQEQQLSWYGRVMRMEDCRIVTHVAGKSRRSRPVSTWQDRIRDSMQRRTLKDEDYLESSGEKKNCLWVEENCVFTGNVYVQYMSD